MNFKKTITFFACLALLSLPAFAEVGTTSFGTTNRINAAATNSTAGAAGVGGAVLCDQMNHAALVIAGSGSASDTGNLLLTFARSGDGTTYETTPRFNVLAALNSTTAIAVWSDVPVTTLGPAYSLKLISVANTNANSAITNFSVKLIKKTIKAAP